MRSRLKAVQGNVVINRTRLDKARPRRDAENYLHLEHYVALGDGRTVALSGSDGSLDWWCVPNLDSPPLFDRLLNPQEGGYFAITPREAFEVERAYRPESNVLETIFTTAGGKARMIIRPSITLLPIRGADPRPI